MKLSFPFPRLVLTVVSIVLPVVLRAEPVAAGEEPAPARGAHSDVPASGDVQLQKQVQSLIVLLDAETLAARTRAENELLKLGPKILSHLPPPELIEPVARREAVRRLRNTLEREQARISVRASRVTLEGTHKLTDVLHAVAAQTGNTLEFSRLSATLGDQTVAVAYRDATFWDVIDDVCEKHKLQFSAGDGTLILSPREAEPNAAVGQVYGRSGAFRLAVHPVRLRPLVGDETHKLVRISGTMLAEPRLRPLYLRYAAGDWQARTWPDADIAVFDPQAVIELPFGMTGQETAFQVDFKLAASAKIETLTLDGRLSALTAAGAEEFDFTRLADKDVQGVARRKGGVTVTLQSVEWLPGERGRSSARIRIAVAYDAGGPAFESHRTWVFHNLSRLERSDGTRFDRRNAFTTTRQADGVVAVEYLFENLEGPASEFRFVYTAPTLVIEAPIRFDGMEIPLKASLPKRRSE